VVVRCHQLEKEYAKPPFGDEAGITLTLYSITCHSSAFDIAACYSAVNSLAQIVGSLEEHSRACLKCPETSLSREFPLVVGSGTIPLRG
jgi:hypothetical protein